MIQRNKFALCIFVIRFLDWEVSVFDGSLFLQNLEETWTFSLLFIESNPFCPHLSFYSLTMNWEENLLFQSLGLAKLAAY